MNMGDRFRVVVGIVETHCTTLWKFGCSTSIVVVCDDGTLWCWRPEGEWLELDKPVPGTYADVLAKEQEDA